MTDDLAALALQGPLSRDILEQVVTGIDVDKLKYFYLAEGIVDGFPVTVTRTGYTGDLGYELWVRPEFAERLWDCLVDRGRRLRHFAGGHPGAGHCSRGGRANYDRRGLCLQSLCCH